MKYLIAGLFLIWGLVVLCALIFILKIVFREEKEQDNFNLTKEDLDFLIHLQHEMLTQDTVCQAAPRFWVVATDTYQELGSEDNCDGVQLYSSDAAEIVCDGDMTSIIEYVEEHYSDKLSEQGITFKECDYYWYAEFGEDNEESFCCTEELLDFLKGNNILNDSYDIIYYRNKHYRYPNTMFLTNRSCKEHIRANHYHYNADAHSYAMTAWRSPEVERLFKILDVIDWKTMRRMAYGISGDAEETSGTADER